MDTAVAILAGAGLGWILHEVLRRGHVPQQPPGPPAPELPAGEADARDAAGAAEPAPDPIAVLYGLRAQVQPAFDAAARPEDLLSSGAFAALCAHLRDGPFEEHDLVQYFDGACPILACAAVVALHARGPSDRALDDVLREISDVGFFARHFALRLLRECSAERAVVGLLGALDESWTHAWGRRVLRDHLAVCLAGALDLDAAVAAVRGNGDCEDGFVAELVADLGEGGAALAERLREAPPDAPARPGSEAAQQPGLPFLSSFARVLRPADDGPILDAATDAAARAIQKALDGGRSAVVVGEAGVGKTAAIRALAARRIADGDTVFEAGAVELLAGQKYVGQLEERLRLLFETFRTAGRRLLWIAPDFHELAWAGRHDNNPTSVLDHLLPHVEDGTVQLVGEVRPAEWERALQLQPSARGAFEVVRVPPRAEPDALALARAVHERRADRGPTPPLGEAELREALQLARHHLDDTALPGSLLRLVDQAVRARGDDRARPLERQDLLAAVGAMTGLPRDVLDDDTRLDLDALRAYFETRVLGQPEAVDLLVERVAMIKAGLCDPSRPQGTFLFTGATGTGKTELAKTLAAWLFGSPERMIRLDMSELQDGGALSRVLGEGGQFDASQSLAQRIRQQPFSVVLLDELEKAHPSVWDLFLQILDDGRLTDRRGRRADFRHAIVIMTSNVGSRQAQGASLGFTGSARDAVVGELKKTFRPEFLNRIDRIVVFRPLGEATMRRVLEKELRLALERRGFRSRQWAVEWDATALDFLLREGFSPELGARPLRRAIEQHLLAPLAKTIVRHEAPAGDQFLFVRSDGQRVDVQFVDPDAPEGGATEPVGGGAAQDVAAIALDGTGSAEEFAVLEQRLAALEAHVASAAWQDRKASALAATAEVDFWTSPARFAVLGGAEYADRIGAGLETASRLLGRLRGERAPRERYDAELVRRLAQQVFLLERAVQDVEEGAPTEAFVQVEAVADAHADDASAFAVRLCGMYEAWGRARGMTLGVLDRRPAGDGGGFRALYAVAGFGAWSLLAPEHGLHVLEVEGARTGETERIRARVSVVPQPAEPPRPDSPRGRRAQARAALDACHVGPDIVRRYREAPSPLVRDAVRGWRTGRFDRVMGGDFDLVR